MKISMRPLRAGFTLIELLLVVAIIALLISILLPALGKSRRAARLAICQSNMRQLITAQLTYGNEHKDRIAALNWIPGKGNSADPALNPAASSSWLLSQGMQACDIVRRRTGRNVPLTQNRFFNRNFWHLPLVDGGYFGSTDPIQPAASCPEDSWVLQWQKNPDNFSMLVGTSPEPSAIPANSYEWYRPYWSTFQIAPVAFAPDRHTSSSRRTISQITNRHHLFTGGGSSPGQLALGQRRYDEAAFPSQKVFSFDIFDRHAWKRPIWHAYPMARQPLAFFDSSVRFLRTSDAREGWNPDQQRPITGVDSPAPTVYQYIPATGFPGYDWPTLSGAASDNVKGYFRWTRGGLRGVDYATDRPRGS